MDAVVGYGNQDEPLRRRSAVEALGRRIVDAYSDKQSAYEGVLDVTKAPYSADPTGRRDSTQAIQQAMKDARDARLVTFLPGGIYLVSDTLACVQGVVTPDHWPFGESMTPANPITAGKSGFNDQSDYFPCVLMGSRTERRSTIVLASRSPGFGDLNRPRAVIHFWARSEDEEPGAMKALLEGDRLDPKKCDPSEPEPLISYNQALWMSTLSSVKAIQELWVLSIKARRAPLSKTSRSTQREPLPAFTKHPVQAVAFMV